MEIIPMMEFLGRLRCDGGFDLDKATLLDTEDMTTYHISNGVKGDYQSVLTWLTSPYAWVIIDGR